MTYAQRVIGSNDVNPAKQPIDFRAAASWFAIGNVAADSRAAVRGTELLVHNCKLM